MAFETPLKPGAGHERAVRARSPRHALGHIPGEDGWPVVGSTFEVLADPKGFVEQMGRRYGPVYRSRALGDTNIGLLGPAANEFVLRDPDRIFSSALGWSVLLERLFPRGLIMLDFEEHRLHRRALSVAFKAGPMHSYLVQLNTGIAAGLDAWANGEMLFYPAIKRIRLSRSLASSWAKKRKRSSVRL